MRFLRFPGSFAAVSVLMFVLIAPARAQTYTYSNMTHSCITSTMKFFFPMMSNPTSIIIYKMFSMARNCHKMTETNAVCHGDLTSVFM